MTAPGTRIRALGSRAVGRVSGQLREKAALDQQALALLQPLMSRYLPWTSWALRPSAVVTLLNEIAIGRRQSILEFGGGISTFFIASLLRERFPGAQLYSVDHDRDWSVLTRSWLSDEGLEGYVMSIVAPLTNGDRWPSGPWYDAAAIDAVLQDTKIDLLIVDGPPASVSPTRQARYPAVHFARERLTPDATIALDDCQRDGERTIVERWSEDLHREFASEPEFGGLALSRVAGFGM